MRILTYLLAGLGAVLPLMSEEVVILSPNGEPLVIDVDQNDRFLETVNMLRSYYGSGDYLIAFESSAASIESRSSQKIDMRKYHAKLTSSETEDVRYIMKTLGMGSILKIAKERSSLKKRGKNIEPIHPLRFLIVIFTDEQLKAGMHGLYGRTWVWDEFWAGLHDSFETESGRNNLNQFVDDFAAKIGLRPNLIKPLIYDKQWNQLIKMLIDKLPRNTNAKRYDM
jgi:hypothetical protein